MLSYIFDCPTCNSSDKETLLRSINRGNISDFEKVVICKHCGLVYKNPVVPDDTPPCYQDPELWNTDYFRQRADELAEYIKSEVDFQPGMKFLEVGAARGLLLNSLKQKCPEIDVYGVEPAVDVARQAARAFPSINMFPSSIDECHFSPGAFDIVAVIGVDYLFLNHGDSMRKISSMVKEGGRIYVERNMFLGKSTLTNQEMFDCEDVVGSNSMFRTWFTDEIFRVQLNRFFDIEKVARSVKQLVPPRNLENYHLGYWCKNNESKTGEACLPNGYEQWYGQNKAWFQNLARQTSIRELEMLKAVGGKRAIIFGFTEESRFLIDLIREIGGLEIAGIVADTTPHIQGYEGYKVVGTQDAASLVTGSEFVLVATLVDHDKAFQVATHYMPQGVPILPCFRTKNALISSIFSSNDENKFQVKAFLPATLSGISKNKAFRLNSLVQAHQVQDLV